MHEKRRGPGVGWHQSAAPFSIQSAGIAVGLQFSPAIEISAFALQHIQMQVILMGGITTG